MTSSSREAAETRQAHLEYMLVQQRNRHHDRDLTNRRRREMLERNMRVLEAQVETLEIENARLRGEVQAIHASTSWRITAPLRHLRRMIGGSISRDL